MNTKRTLQRAGWLITCEGEDLEIGRSEHSLPLCVKLADIPLLMADLREISEAASPRRAAAELFVISGGESER